jgi:uncharacterized protein YydD (DUF2326 family)
VQILKEQATQAENLERLELELEGQRVKLQQALQQDIHERADRLRDAIVIFEELSESFYEKAGRLSIGVSASGPEFELHIEGDRSKGINSMQIFCFDMTIMALAIKHGMGPGFVIHDSHLFDGVDERQKARAIEIGAEFSKRNGFQYIVTMNSDDLPRSAFHADFRVDDYVIEPRLFDTENGGIFGIRFQ